MADEALFQSALDAHLDDSAARFLFADWLAQRGDARSAGYRYMAISHKHPYRSYATWEWWDSQSANPPEIILPIKKWQALPVEPPIGYPRCKEYASRRKAEEALCALLASKRQRRSKQ